MLRKINWWWWTPETPNNFIFCPKMHCIQTDNKRWYYPSTQPILLYGSETWALTPALEDSIAAFDNICLRRILQMSYMDHVTNADVGLRLRASSPLQLLPLIQTRRLCFFGHVAQMGDSCDLYTALHTSIRGLPKDSRRRPRRPRHTWLWTLEADLQPLNHGLNSAWRHAQDRGCWKQLVETAIRSSQGHARDDDDDIAYMLLSNITLYDLCFFRCASWSNVTVKDAGRGLLQPIFL